MSTTAGGTRDPKRAAGGGLGPDADDDAPASDVATDRAPHGLPTARQRGAGARAACIVEIHGANLGAVHPLEKACVVLGRDVSCDVVVDTTAASRRHAALDVRPGGVWIRDLGSTNGTLVNDVPIDEEQELHDGDLIHVGTTIFKLLRDRDVEAAYHREMHRLTVEDGLTGLANRAHLMASMDREVRRARRYGRPLALVMLDVDHFKRVNDEHGHLVGDAVLRELAALLRDRARSLDLVARFGGEELAMLLPETTQEGARQLAESVRQLVAQRELRAYGATLQVTVSAGVAELSREVSTAEALVQVADENLYLAKSTGRNRVIG